MDTNNKNPEAGPKFCRDCDHSRTTGRGTPADPVCEAPENYIDHVDAAKTLVTGIPHTVKAMRSGNCAGLRLQHSEEMDAQVCGPAGKWFTPKTIQIIPRFAGLAVAGTAAAAKGD